MTVSNLMSSTDTSIRIQESKSEEQAPKQIQNNFRSIKRQKDNDCSEFKAEKVKVPLLALMRKNPSGVTGL